MTSEELLHGGLFQIALLGEHPIQNPQQRIHIVQRFRNRSLLIKWWDCDGEQPKCCLVDRREVSGLLAANEKVALGGF